MSYANSVMTACPDFQALLADYHKGCEPSFFREPMPFWDFVWSDINTTGLQQIIVPGDNGKVRNVVLLHEQRLLESEATTVSSCDLNCTATAKRGDISTSYTINPCDAVEASELMEAKDFLYNCENNPSVVARKIQRLIDVVIRKLATRLVNRAVTLRYKWAAGIDATTSSNWMIVKTQKDGSIDPMPNTWQDIRFAMQQSAFCDLPTVIIGGAKLHKYAGLMESGCCTTAGWDIGDIFNRYGQAVLYDKRVNNAIGSEYAWVIQAGSLKPLYFVLNNNQVQEGGKLKLGLEGSGGNYLKGVLADMRSGFPVDVLLSDNCGKMSIIVRGNADIKGSPLDLFPTGDDYDGVTGFAGIKVQNV